MKTVITAVVVAILTVSPLVAEHPFLKTKNYGFTVMTLDSLSEYDRKSMAKYIKKETISMTDKEAMSTCLKYDYGHKMNTVKKTDFSLTRKDCKEIIKKVKKDGHFWLPYRGGRTFRKDGLITKGSLTSTCSVFSSRARMKWMKENPNGLVYVGRSTNSLYDEVSDLRDEVESLRDELNYR